MPPNATASPTTAAARAAPNRSLRASSKVALPTSPSRCAVIGPVPATSASHATGINRTARPPRPAAVRTEPPTTSRSGPGSGGPDETPSPSSTLWETPIASSAESKMAAMTPRSPRPSGRSTEGAGPPRMACTMASETRWPTPTQPRCPSHSTENQSMPSRPPSFPGALGERTMWSGRISTSPTPFAAMVTADGMRRRARASAAAHFAASAGSCGKASYEKACHRAWAVMVGRV